MDLKNDHLELFLKDSAGRPFKAFDPVDKAVSATGRKLVFAMNAGMYEDDWSPAGLFVADGKLLAPLNLRHAPGNFYMKPGGVFMVGNGGARVVDRETYPAVSSGVKLATQSGPMLVQYGRINPLFNPASVSRLIRNGVGVTSHGEVIFAIAEDSVNFYEFATLFRDLLHCPDALFLDGTVSSLFAPELGRDDVKIDLGPIIGVTKRRTHWTEPDAANNPCRRLAACLLMRTAMPQFPNLSRAPITEAMLTFQANAAARWEDQGILDKLKSIWPEHPHVHELHELAMHFSAQKGEPPVHDDTKAKVMGWIFRSDKEPTAHQARRDGYTFSRFKPYENWEVYEKAAREGWLQYSELLKPDPLHGVAVRVINLLGFPAADFKLSHYFTAPPPRPSGLDWQVGNFVQHAMYSIPDSQCVVQVTLSPSFSAVPSETLVYMLDIGVTLKQSLPSSGANLDDVLKEMHLRKNEAFFGMLTEAALSLYI